MAQWPENKNYDLPLVNVDYLKSISLLIICRQLAMHGPGDLIYIGAQVQPIGEVTGGDDLICI